MRIIRQFREGMGTEMQGYICDLDMSMITGLDISAFRKAPDHKPLMKHLKKCKADGLYYAPTISFEELWRHQNEVVAGIKIPLSLIRNYDNNIYIRVKFKEEEHNGNENSAQVSE